MTQLVIQIKNNKIVGLGGSCTARELPQEFERLKKILNGEEID